jgi:hypothetical protein
MAEAKWEDYLTFQRLIDHCLILSELEYDTFVLKMAVVTGNLKRIKSFMKTTFGSVNFLKEAQVSVANYHVWLWFHDQKHLEGCSIL